MREGRWVRGWGGKEGSMEAMMDAPAAWVRGFNEAVGRRMGVQSEE